MITAPAYRGARSAPAAQPAGYVVAAQSSGS